MKNFLHGGNIYAKESPTGTWLDFSANINPLGMPDPVRETIREHLENIVHYPEPEAPRLKSAIAEHYGVSAEQIILGNGASELFYLFFHTVRPKHVLIPVPSFSEYERSARAAGAECLFFPLMPEERFSVDPEKLKQAVPTADCLILGNPNNPTGTLIPREEMESLADTCKKNDCRLIVDESFLDFREDGERYTVRHLVPGHSNLFVIRSMTKFYAIPGLRLGFGIADGAFKKRMEQGKDVWNVNLLAQCAGIAALSDGGYEKRTRAWLREEQNFLVNELRRLPAVEIIDPTVNFMLLKCGSSLLAAKILDGMRQRGILLRDCGNYRGLESGEYLRMAIRSHEENARLVQAWKEILREEDLL